jgi:hypothetical protein
MKSMRLFALFAAIWGWTGLAAIAAPAPTPWDQPAATLAEQIAEILGPGQARLTLRNLSSTSAGELPGIQHLLEQDLKTHGITISGEESANAVRVTLSETARQRLWVAEITEGDQTQVAMVELAPDKPLQTMATGGLLLRKETILTMREPVLAALEVADKLVVLEPQQIVIEARTVNGWQEAKRINIREPIPFPRDPRGILMASNDGAGFEAWLAGTHCTGNNVGDVSVQCSASDDPWPVTRPLPPMPGNAAIPSAGTSPAIKAFYNTTRNYFTGVVSPSLDVELPAFYTAALLPRAAGDAALLIAGVDGKVRLAQNGALNPVAGVRDWGSDIGVIRSGCGLGVQVIASGSGEAASDSLRAYELPALEAVPVSAPLTMQGTVTAIWSAPDAKSIYTTVRIAPNQYEVDRVSALCN